MLTDLIYPVAERFTASSITASICSGAATVALNSGATFSVYKVDLV